MGPWAVAALVTRDHKASVTTLTSVFVPRAVTMTNYFICSLEHVLRALRPQGNA